MQNTVEQRFWKHVKCDGISSCWNWTGAMKGQRDDRPGCNFRYLHRLALKDGSKARTHDK